jgi:hypothetical protein
VQEIMALLGLVATMTTVAVLAIAVGRFASSDDTWSWTDAFSASWADRWPVGVQEEEPVRWRVEALGEPRRIDPRPAAPRTADGTAHLGMCGNGPGRTPAPGSL